MISGLNASGIASAIRTAGQARVTMDKAARELATGQRVASVKDDGAAWARANAARVRAADFETLGTHLEQMKSWAAVRRAGFEESQAMWHDIRANLLAMLQPGTSTASFNAMRATTQALFAHEVSANFRTFYDGIDGLTGPALDQAATARAYMQLRDTTGADMSGSQVLAPNGAPIAPGLRAYAGSLIDYSSTAGMVRTNAGGTINLVLVDSQLVPRLDTVADVQATLGFMSSAMTDSVMAASQIGNTAKVLDQLDTRLARDADRNRAAAEQLVDADLGKASASRAKAETRQELALATVRQAINTYGAYAGGLLGNVQRTQRSLVA